MHYVKPKCLLNIFSVSYILKMIISLQFMMSVIRCQTEVVEKLWKNAQETSRSGSEAV